MSSTDSLCPYCNTYSSEHDYEHLARECYPARIEALESKCDALAARVEQLLRDQVLTKAIIEKIVEKNHGWTPSWLIDLAPNLKDPISASLAAHDAELLEKAIQRVHTDPCFDWDLKRQEEVDMLHMLDAAILNKKGGG